MPALRRFTGAINRINSHVQGFVEAHGRGRLRFLDCRSFLLSETEDIDEELMPDSAYPNAAGEQTCCMQAAPFMIAICQAATAPSH